MKTINILPIFTPIACAIAIAIPSANAADASVRAGGHTSAHGFDYGHQHAWHLESGNSQSPINIETKAITRAEAFDDEDDAISIHSDHASAKVIDTGHTIQIVPGSGSATIRGRHFTLQQIHFHAPAEHTLDGKTYPLEGHFVFRAQDGRLAVVAVFYRPGAGNVQFAAAMRAVKHGETTEIASFDADMLLPKRIDNYFHYLGSLTTPPLIENVEWYVITDPAELSVADIGAFTQHYSHNARNAQPLNGRPLLRYGSH
ncbi:MULTISPECIES: carbonic anhydrase family protein [Burkholderia]|uniref:carbonic anhydrase n=1 Tax=Burkholderia pyrrocinia TaxID=60550 RepID=A0A318I396_BURPY|nr:MULTISPECIES: carbonic anhydrase family protein [Burkholderia]PXX22047.1 carbonic anhydrase [Burkholderia pyrrocinia]SFW90062.1 carbonic anhydrase [Burkholderia sp. NFACC33-1]SFY46395.1 carbonic anhydrase [Burkholderia sp. NFPP32]